MPGDVEDGRELHIAWPADSAMPTARWAMRSVLPNLHVAAARRHIRLIAGCYRNILAGYLWCVGMLAGWTQAGCRQTATV